MSAIMLAASAPALSRQSADIGAQGKGGAPDPASPAALLQAPPRVAVEGTAIDFPRDHLTAIEEAVPRGEDGEPKGFSRRLFQMPHYSDAFIRVVAPDRPHSHGKWSEVYFIVSGEAELETGGTIVDGIVGSSAVHRDMFLNAKRDDSAATDVANAASAEAGTASPETMPDDAEQAPLPARKTGMTGSDIAGGHRRMVGAGDVILIPANTPHRWTRIVTPIVYHDVKFPQ